MIEFHDSMKPCPHCGRPVRANTLICDFCHRSSNEQPKREPLPPFSLLTGRKRCRRCGSERYLVLFPRDQSRPDGYWHTCILCNRDDWKQHGKARAIQRKLDDLLERARNSRTGLVGLKKYHNGPGFDALPTTLRIEAQRILSRFLARAKAEGRHLSQPQIALRIASAVSNCWRVGDSTWRRRMLRLKGYRRAERRKAVEQARLAEVRTKNAEGKLRSKLLPTW
jgi:hypothetical protein